MKVVIAGGGTGGHLFPGVALAEELKARGHDVLFVGTAKGIEARVLPERGWPLELIDVAGIKGRGVAGLFGGLFRVPRALLQSRRILNTFNADLVVGVGGYASGPVVLAAALGGRPTAILEQNSIPGITNRVLSRVVKRVFTAFRHAERYFPSRKVRLLGNPVRAAFLPHAPAPSPASGRGAEGVRVLVCGGSQGAHRLNELVVEAVVHLHKSAKAPRVLHQTGAKDVDDVTKRYADAGVDAEVKPFIDDMAAAYRAADLVVCRAGATTLAELTALGMPSILVPFPFATDDHQRTNAEELEAAGAARVFVEKTLTGDALARSIDELLADSLQRSKMSAAAKALGKPDAAARIADEVLGLVAKQQSLPVEGAPRA